MIAPNETRLAGKLVLSQGRIVGDAICERIDKLIGGYLMKLGHDQSGWDTLYRDPKDGRLWELIYPQSELQGGGPPELRYLPTDEATQKYGQAANTEQKPGTPLRYPV
jgi:hypothetical protein